MTSDPSSAIVVVGDEGDDECSIVEEAPLSEGGGLFQELKRNSLNVNAIPHKVTIAQKVVVLHSNDFSIILCKGCLRSILLGVSLVLEKEGATIESSSFWMGMLSIAVFWQEQVMEITVE